MRKISIRANLAWIAEPSGDRDRWIASCEPLGISIEANSQEEISGLISEALDLLFLDLFEDDELDQFLADRHWRKEETFDDKDGGVEFDVPWQLVMDSAHGAERSAH